MITPQQEAQIDALFSPFSQSGPGCAVGITQDLEPVFQKAYGLANLDFDVPITTDTVFQLASVSKQFTAMAIIILAQESDLSLDDDIRKYVPEMPEYGAPITVRDLMHHTAGLRDIYMLGTLRGESEKDYYTADQFLDLVSRQKSPVFTPGSDFRYSNTGYLLMGIIVERVSGQTLAEYTQEKIFGPLGMTKTFFEDDMTRVVKNRATGYFKQEDGRYKRGVTLLEMPGDGGVMSTLGDLMKWDRDYYEGKVWRPEIKAEMLRPGTLSNGEPAYFPVEKDGVYAGGLIVGKRGGLPIVRHGGTFVGFRTDMVRYPEQKLGILVLCNLGSADPNTLSNQITDILLRDQYTEAAETASVLSTAEIPPAPPAIPQALQDDVVGTYYSEELSTTYYLVEKDGTIEVQMSGRRIPLDYADYLSSPIGLLEEDTIGNEVFAFAFRRDDGAITGFDLSLVGGFPFAFIRVD